MLCMLLAFGGEGPALGSCVVLRIRGTMYSISQIYSTRNQRITQGMLTVQLGNFVIVLLNRDSQ